jgi:hypothetical protein
MFVVGLGRFLWSEAKLERWRDGEMENWSYGVALLLLGDAVSVPGKQTASPTGFICVYLCSSVAKLIFE